MNINANELLLLSKKVRFGEEAGKPAQPQIIEQPTTQETNPQAGMNALMFQGMNNVVGNPQLATNLNVMREEVAEEGQQTVKNNTQEEATPLKTNVAFQGKASKFKNVAMGALMALMSLGAASSLQSCQPDVNVSQSVDIDMAAITELISQMQALMQQMKEQQEITNSELQKINAYLLQLMQEVQNGNINQEQFYQKMYTYMIQNKANQEIIIQQLVNNGKSQEEANKLIKDLIAKVDAGIISAQQAMETIQNLLGDIKGLLGQVISSLNKAEKDRAEFKELLKENNANVKELIEQGKTIIASDSVRNAKLDDLASAIKNLNIDMNSGIDKLADKLNMSTNQLIAVMKQLGYNQEQITKMTAAEILAAIKENTAETKKNGEIMLVGFNNLEGIIKDYGAKGEAFAKDVLNYIAAVGFEMNRNFGDLIAEVKAGRVSLDEIKALIAAMNKNIEQNGEAAKDNTDKILNYIAAVGYEMNRNFTAILNAINNGGKGTEKIEALLEKVLEKQDQNMNKIDTNCKAIIEAMGNIKVDGGKIDLSSIEAMLKDLLAQSKKNGNTLSSIDGKLNVIQITQQAILDKINAEAHKGDQRYERADAFMTEVLDKLGNQSGAGKYDDTKLLEALKGLSNLIDNKTDKLLDAIKDHDVKVTVDVTGKVKCECNCGQNHEGILGDINNILK